MLLHCYVAPPPGSGREAALASSCRAPLLCSLGAFIHLLIFYSAIVRYSDFICLGVLGAGMLPTGLYLRFPSYDIISLFLGLSSSVQRLFSNCWI